MPNQHTGREYVILGKWNFNLSNAFFSKNDMLVKKHLYKQMF